MQQNDSGFFFRACPPCPFPRSDQTNIQTWDLRVLALPGTTETPHKVYPLPRFILDSTIPEILKRNAPFLCLKVNASHTAELSWAWPAPQDFKNYFRSLLYDEQIIVDLTNAYTRYNVGGLFARPNANADGLEYKKELEGTSVPCLSSGCKSKLLLSDYFFVTVESDKFHARSRSRHLVWYPPCATCCKQHEWPSDLAWSPGKYSAQRKHSDNKELVGLIDEMTTRIVESLNTVCKLRIRGRAFIPANNLLQSSSAFPASFCLSGSLGLQRLLNTSVDPIHNLCQLGINPGALPEPVCKSVLAFVHKVHKLSESMECTKSSIPHPATDGQDAAIMQKIVAEVCRAQAMDVFVAEDGTKHLIRSEDAKRISHIRIMLKDLGDNVSFHCFCSSEAGMVDASASVMGPRFTGEVYVPIDMENRVEKLGFVTANIYAGIDNFVKIATTSDSSQLYVLFSECLTGTHFQNLLAVAHRHKKKIGFIGAYRRYAPPSCSDNLRPFRFLVSYYKVPVQWCPDDFIAADPEAKRRTHGLVHLNAFETAMDLGTFLYDSGHSPITVMPPVGMDAQWAVDFLHSAMSQIGPSRTTSAMSLIFKEPRVPELKRIKSVAPKGKDFCFTIDETEYKCRRKTDKSQTASELFLRTKAPAAPPVSVITTILTKTKSYIVPLSSRVGYPVPDELHRELQLPAKVSFEMLVDPRQTFAGLSSRAIFEIPTGHTKVLDFAVYCEKQNNPYLLLAYSLSTCIDEKAHHNPMHEKLVEWALESELHPFVCNHDRDQVRAILTALEGFFLACNTKHWGNTWSKLIKEDSSDDEVFSMGKQWLNFCEGACSARDLSARCEGSLRYVCEVIRKKLCSDAPVSLPSVISEYSWDEKRQRWARIQKRKRRENEIKFKEKRARS